MATERQIEASRRNGSLGKGPTSETGKEKSRLNALKHGMAAKVVGVEATLSPEFEERRARWGVEHEPVGESANWALDRAVAATLRIERCEKAVDQVITAHQQRAMLAWDLDRAVEAAKVAGRLSKDPVLASRQLQTTFAGVLLLLEAWVGLLAALENGDWSDSEVSKALDLLGVDADLRNGRTLIDAPEVGDAVAFRRSLAREEIERLEQLRDEALAPLEDMEQRQAISGASALLSNPARLLLRYEREAWKRYWDSMKEVEASKAEVVPEPAVVKPPRPVAKTAPPPERPKADRRESRTESRPIVRESTDRLVTLDLADDAWLNEFDRTSSLPGGFVPIAVGVGVSAR